MRILHPFSGGIDSTSVLWQLVEQGHDVTALHIDIAFGANLRWKAERQAVENILRWLRDRGHTVRDVYAGRIEPAGCWWDIEVVAVFVGNALLADRSIEAVTTSTSATDKAMPGWASRNANRGAITEIVARRRPTWLKPNITKTRAEVIAAMPPDLLAMTASCRSPIVAGDEFRPCGRCATCRVTPALAGR